MVQTVLGVMVVQIHLRVVSLHQKCLFAAALVAIHLVEEVLDEAPAPVGVCQLWEQKLEMILQWNEGCDKFKSAQEANVG